MTDLIGKLLLRKKNIPECCFPKTEASEALPNGSHSLWMSWISIEEIILHERENAGVLLLIDCVLHNVFVVLLFLT